MRRNGMCPICYLRGLFVPPKPFIETYKVKPVENGAKTTPIMGWSSWNTFRNQIDEQLILDTAKAMKETGLLDAGYEYVNLDDNWHSSERTVDGRIQGDPARFPDGIPALVQKLNALGFKAGVYSSNGTLTCEDLPASLHREALDARTFASFGAEYLKYDYCHHEIMSSYAPIVYGIEISRLGTETRFYDCQKARLFGNAKFMKDKETPGGYHVSGLDKNAGYMEYDIPVEEEGDYVLTVCIRKFGSKYNKVLAALIEDEIYLYDVPEQKKPNKTARFQKTVRLKKGVNTIRFFNPCARRSDGAFLQYYTMAKELAAAAKERAGEFKPITFSICEWGWNSPYKWGKYAGNMWRTTPDIRPWFIWIKLIYGHTVKLYKYAAPGHFNDPDMLEVGNGKLTENQNVAHFSLWCMMNAPLVLGNDIRKITPEILKIVTNKDMIAIDQDPLALPCKRLKKGTVDVLAKPLSDGKVTLCLFNRAKSVKKHTVALDKVLLDDYINRPVAKSYLVKDVWENELYECDATLKTEIKPECVKVFILEPKE